MDPRSAAVILDESADRGARIVQGEVTDVVDGFATVTVDGGGTARPAVVGAVPAVGERVVVLFDPSDNGSSFILGSVGGTPYVLGSAWTDTPQTAISTEVALTGLSVEFTVRHPNHLHGITGHVRVDPSAAGRRAVLRAVDQDAVALGTIAEVHFDLAATASLDGTRRFADLAPLDPGEYVFSLTLAFLGGGSCATVGYADVCVLDFGANDA